MLLENFPTIRYLHSFSECVVLSRSFKSAVFSWVLLTQSKGLILQSGKALLITFSSLYFLSHQAVIKVICDLRPVIRAIESKFYNIYFCLSPWLRDSDVGPPAYAANTTPTESSPRPVLFLQDVFTEILHHH